MKEINRLLFSDEMIEQNKSVENLKFYNKVKEVVIRCNDSEKSFNLKEFTILLKELRIKLDVLKEGLGPYKFNRIINFGLEPKKKSSSLRSNKKSDAIRKKRIEQLVFKDFNTINISRIIDAINGSD